ncbi:MAG: ribokinase-like protein domain-containing protein [Deltaproteobacteria bacterium CSP1-8]|jgi:sugar/nucleoside kinase (ribokinase family)|nr:MAG: ribokinase-like protein domain-containing protein [Deltaproteobacteria bacterium CSP1-8]
MFDVVGIGLNAIDYLCCVPRYPVPGEKLRMTGFSRQGGGQVATALVALSRWGLRAMYVGNVGDDEHGRLSLFLLREEGIDLSRARTVPGAVSQFAVILVQGDSGERTILWERDARLRIRPGDIPREEIRRSRAVFIDGHDVPASLESARVARGAGVPVVLDAEKVQEGTEELLGLCDHIVAASSFVAHLFPGMDPASGVREIYRSFSPRTATVTLGGDGAAGFDGREFVHARGIRVEAADTTGAGDVFHAGFLFALLAGKPFPEILSFSNAAAGLSCRKSGGRAGIPSLDEIHRTFLR